MSPSASPTALLWTRCAAVDGCTGRADDRFRACPAHLRPDQMERFLRGLRPGGDLDLRGATVPAGLLAAVLDAVTGPDGRPHLGRTRLDGAVLPSHAPLRNACFEGDSSFDGAAFVGGASFFDVRFLGHVSFRGARFAGNVSFHAARFGRHASFDETVFAGDALFGEAAWNADASFAHAVFIGAACFDRARFGRDALMQAACFGGAVSFRRVRVARQARFDRARFRHDLWLGPLVAERLTLANATAHGGLRVDAAARELTARAVTVRGAADFRLRHADIDLEDASFDGSAAVRPLAHRFQQVPEPESWPGDGAVRVTSLRGVTAERLDLADVDLSACRFAGLRRAGSLRITGGCSFATAPRGRWWNPWRNGRGHAVLADDPSGPSGADWPGGLGEPGEPFTRTSADRLEALYRQLARATAGSDAGLARDFRYSALEIRRHAEPDQWRRMLLHLLWVTCGYGLRAGRAFIWLALVAVLLLCLVTVVRGGRSPAAAQQRAPHPSPYSHLRSP